MKILSVIIDAWFIACLATCNIVQITCGAAISIPLPSTTFSWHIFLSFLQRRTHTAVAFCILSSIVIAVHERKVCRLVLSIATTTKICRVHYWNDKFSGSQRDMYGTVRCIRCSTCSLSIIEIHPAHHSPSNTKSLWLNYSVRERTECNDFLFRVIINENSFVCVCMCVQNTQMFTSEMVGTTNVHAYALANLPRRTHPNRYVAGEKLKIHVRH